MKALMKKILNKKDTSDSRKKDIEKTANAVFKEYKKSFKDLALYDKGEKVSTN